METTQDEGSPQIIPRYTFGRGEGLVSRSTTHLDGYLPHQIFERFEQEAYEWKQNPTKIPTGYRGTASRSITMRLRGDRTDAEKVITDMRNWNVKVIMDYAKDGSIILTCMEVCFLRD